MNCDCWFCRIHQLGATEKELPGLHKRAWGLTVEFLGMRENLWLFLVKGGEAEHYVTLNPDGDAGGLAMCKHIIAVRNLLSKARCLGKKCTAECRTCMLWERFSGQTQDIPEIVAVEDSGEVEPPEVPCDVSAVR